MDALLKIKAQVDGEGAIAGLAKGLGGLKDKAESASNGLGGMLASAGGLSGALGSLVPLVSGIGLVAMAKSAIDAADNMNDLSQKTGVSVEELSKWQQAAKAGGTDIETAGKAMMFLSRGMVKAGEDTDEYGKKSEEALKKATKAVEDGEERQVAAVKDAADERLAALEQESSDRLREINKRYKQEQRLLDDSYDDQADAAKTAAQDQQDRDSESIKARYEAKKKAIKDDEQLTDEQRSQLLSALDKDQEAELKALDKGYQEKQKERTRQFRDEKQERDDALEDRKRLEEKKIKEAADAAKAITKESADSQVELIKDSTKQQLESLKDLEQGPRGVAAALKELGISSIDAAGKLKDPGEVMKEIADKLAAMPDGARKTDLAFQLMSKSGGAMIPVLNGGRESIDQFNVTMTTKFAKAADQFNDKTVVMGAKVLVLGIQIGTKLMPYLNMLTDALISLANGFGAMPEWAQNGIMAVGGLALAMGPLVKSIELAMVVINALKVLQLGAIIGGWAGAIGPAMGVISAAFTGLLAFLTGTVLPALIAFFSGPVGWTVLAVAAVVAMCIYFREPIGKFLTWAGDTIGKGWAKVVDKLKKPIVDYFDFWMNGWKKAGEFVTGAFTKAKDISKNLVEIIGGFMKLVFTRVVTGAVRAFNSSINTINTIISNLKNVPFIGEPLKAVGLIPQMKIPKFAQGGIVSRPTVAMVGEGGESEYIIPESKLKALYNQINSTMEQAMQGQLQQFRLRGVSEQNISRQEQIYRSLREGEIQKKMGQYILTDQNNRNNTPLNSNLDYSSLKSLAQLFPEAIKPLLDEMERSKTAVLDNINARMADSIADWQKTQEKQQQEMTAWQNDQSKKIQSDMSEWRKTENERLGNLYSSAFEQLMQATISQIKESDISISIAQLANLDIKVTTGPVLNFNGSEYVTFDDLRNAMTATARAVLDSLRNPSTRISLGLV
ncbi:MAG: hypothetical protein WCF98_08875 [Synechococcus sp. ELA057]